MNFNYISPTKIIFGNNRCKEIGKIIKEYGYKKILIHYGQNSIKKSGLYDLVIKSLEETNIDYFSLGGVRPNPTIELVREGVRLVKDEGFDLILAIGGGSVIDSAKAIGVGACVDFDPWLFNSHEKVPTKTIPVGVILTISAAGSELSNSCVISNKTIKNGFNSDLIRPQFVIMDPTITYTVSPYQTACGIVDIMMHTLERFITDQPAETLSQEWALSLLKEVMVAGRKVMDDRADNEARRTLMLASSFSHNGLTGLGGKMYFTVHKIEHVISGIYPNISHGAGLSVIFPAWALVVYPYLKEPFKRISYEVLNVIKTNDENKDIETGISKLKDYFDSLGIETSLLALGIKEEEFEIMVDCLTDHYTKTVPGFIPLDENKLRKIFELAK